MTSLERGFPSYTPAVSKIRFLTQSQILLLSTVSS